MQEYRYTDFGDVDFWLKNGEIGFVLIKSYQKSKSKNQNQGIAGGDGFSCEAGSFGYLENGFVLFFYIPSFLYSSFFRSGFPSISESRFKYNNSKHPQASLEGVSRPASSFCAGFVSCTFLYYTNIRRTGQGKSLHFVSPLRGLGGVNLLFRGFPPPAILA